MNKKKLSPTALAIRENSGINAEAFVSYKDSDNYSSAFTAYGKALDKIEPIQRSVGGFRGEYRNIETGVSVREGYSRSDYDFFRPGETVPHRQKDIIASCMSAYDKIGIIRNIIDTMSDFASQGIRFSHPNKKIEEFYNSWFRKVNGPDRTERFLNLLYRSGNVITKRSRGKLRANIVEDFKRGIAQEHIDYEDDFESVNYKEIPLRYTFLNPMTVDVRAAELSAFTGKSYYTINISPRLVSIINNPKDEYEVDMVNSIPSDIVNPVRNGIRHIPISDDDLIVYHYKKDDWQIWANPMTYAILDDLIALEKMKLADLAALDGAISHIRIWKLGSLEHQILPTNAAIQKLSDLLMNNVGGGSMDLIWGPDLTLDETSTEIYKFLGSAKYETTLMNIYAGLGVPPTMTGSSAGGGAGGFNNNFISLKTLTERLKYGRRISTEFWSYEARMVQKAMRFKQPPEVLYDIVNLSDEVAEKALWVQLVDRMIISEETLQERFGQIPEVERRRLDKEYGRRKNRKLAPKASPFHDADPDLSLLKLFTQRGVVTPSEVGIVLEERSPGEKSMFKMQQEQKTQQLNTKPKGQPGQGRPLNKKDSQQRKKRAVTTTKASEEFINLSMWASDAQNIIAEIVAPFFLDKFGKTNLRQLTASEEKEFEEFKFILLCNLPTYSEVDVESVHNLIQQDLSVYNDMNEMVNTFVAEFVEKRGTEPNLGEKRQIQCFVYSIFKGDFDGDNNDND